MMIFTFEIYNEVWEVNKSDDHYLLKLWLVIRAALVIEGSLSNIKHTFIFFKLLLENIFMSYKYSEEKRKF